MRARRILGRTLTLGLLALTLLLVYTSVSGRPIASYASSGSMEPTIDAFDGFLVQPWWTSLEHGDIIVFDSVIRGGPAVHRIVGGSSEAGWETQGDANARPDQTLGEPPVTRERILGKVVTRADGSPVVIERLGITVLEARAKLVLLEQAAGGPRQILAAGLLVVAGLAAIPATLSTRRRLPPRMPARARVALRRLFPRGILGRHVGIALVLVVAGSSLFAATHAAQPVVTSMIVLADRGAADETRAAGRGDELRRDIEVSALGLLPTLVMVDPATERLRSEEESAVLGPRAKGEVTVWQRAGDEVGAQEDLVQVYRYPAVLPRELVVALHHALPGSPYLVLGALASALGALWFARLRISTLPVARTLGIPEDWL